MTKKFLELDEREAQFFEFSKEPKEGFSEHKSTQGKISFRKYYKKGVKGVLKYINEREEEFPTGKVRKLNLVVDNGDDRYYLNFHILTAKGNLNQFVEQLIPFLPNLKQNTAYRFFPYEMENTYVNKDGVEKTGTNKGVSVAEWDLDSDTKGTKVERAHTFGAAGDIPAIVWNKVTKMGETKNIKDDTDRLNFLYDVLKKSLTPGNTPQTQQTPGATASSPTTTQTETKAETTLPFSEEEQDDLPF